MLIDIEIIFFIYYIIPSIIPNFNRIDYDNSTSINLNASVVFTGIPSDVQKYDSLSITILSDVDSDVTGVQISFSADNLNWTVFNTFTYLANTKFFQQVDIKYRYYKLTYINGGSPTTNISIQSKLIVHSSDEFSDLQSSYFIKRSQMKHAIHKFGRNTDIDTGSTPEDIWGGGGVYTGFDATSAEALTVVSDNAADNGTGTGARTILLKGLDENYDEIEELVTLTGLTPTAITTKLFIRMADATVKTVGSGGKNAGSLTVTNNISGIVFAVMPVGGNQTHIACHTIPANKTGYVIQWGASIIGFSGSIRDGDIFVEVREFGSGFAVKTLTTVVERSNFDVILSCPIELPAKSDIRLTCGRVSGNDTTIVGTYDIVHI